MPLNGRLSLKALMPSVNYQNIFELLDKGIIGDIKTNIDMKSAVNHIESPLGNMSF